MPKNICDFFHYKHYHYDIRRKEKLEIAPARITRR